MNELLETSGSVVLHGKGDITAPNVKIILDGDNLTIDCWPVDHVVVVIGGLGGAVERFDVSGEMLTQLQFVGRYGKSRRWRGGDQRQTDSNEQWRMAA